MPQLVAPSGPKSGPPLKPPARTGAAAPTPPRMLMPGGRLMSGTTAPLGSVNEPVAGQVAALPGVPLPPGPRELISFHAPEPTGGSAPPAPQPAWIGSGFTARPCKI